MARMILSILSLLVLPAYALGHEISIFGSDCSSPNLTVTPESSFDLKICAHLDAQPSPSCMDPGMAGACRIRGIPDSWVVSATPNPEALYAKEDPTTSSGGEIFVPLDGASIVTLYTLTVTVPAEAVQVELSLEGNEQECPMFRYIAQNCDWAPACAETHPSRSR